MFGTGPKLVYWGDEIGSRDIIELTYFEIIRYFGILGATIFFVVIFYLCLKLKQNKKTTIYYTGVLAYFGMNFVNPYIWGLTGLPLLAIPFAISFYRH